jgi:predicted DNA-binding transcriptional regulator AlpA
MQDCASPRITAAAKLPRLVRYMREPELRARYGVSSATVWRWARDGTIPPPVKVGANTTCWIAAEVDRVDEAREAGRSVGEVKRLVREIIAERGSSL